MGVLIHHLPVINASEEQVVLTSLLLQYAAHPFFNRLDYDHRAVKQPFVLHLLEKNSLQSL